MQYDNYFEYRQVTPTDYAGFNLPAYLKKVIAAIAQPKVLDFGCGFGQMMYALKNAGIAELEGLDIEPNAIAHCQSLGYICHDGSAESDFYDKRKGYYDFIIMSHVIEHFPKDLIIPQLSKIRELLKPGGALIVAVPNAQSNTGAYWAYEDFTHNTLFTSGSLYLVLRAAGYSSVEFLDIDCTEGLSLYKRMVKKALLGLYTFNYLFWNRVTSSSTHRPSPLIFSYEIKALARW